MTLSDVHTNFDYDEWANARMLAAVAALEAEQLTRDLHSSFASIRDTVAHIVGGEWVWMRRWKGESPAGMPEWMKTMTLDELVSRLTEIQDERRVWLASLTESDLNRPLAFTMFNGKHDAQPLLAQLLHIVNHSTYHRGQITTMIRQVGGKVVGTDRITFSREQSA